MKQLTVRGFDKDLQRRLRAVAKTSEFLQAIGGLEEIDPSLWR